MKPINRNSHPVSPDNRSSGKQSSTKRRDRHRKRSKRRAIFCPIHQCYLDSVSQKHRIYADQPDHLQSRGLSRRKALLLVATKTTVPLDGEWLEAFWCKCCQETKWYHVRKCDREYQLSLASPELWQQATGVISVQGNPSVSEFTRRQSQCQGSTIIKDFRFVN
ncbi:hypothetical protein [Picosynechococcus sp. PCC 8807]|uniref:hypothetical protein n=1 Tax=Picosynechococcus sp. PCC 8807 TaxID=195248 RepID=UPI000903BD80|nr:hypothetical protein [Picosynechococcus sp. PCC 8807]